MIIIDRSRYPRIPSYISVGVAPNSAFDNDDYRKLHALEYNKFKSLKNSKRKKEYLASRLLLKHLSEKANAHIAYIGQDDEYGAPYGHSAISETKWQLSISHCNTMACCALSDSSHPVGVDIEPKSRTITPRLKERFLHKNELDLAKQEPAIKLWTLKEAVVKLLKTGLRTNLNSFYLIAQDTNCYRVIIEAYPKNISVICIPYNEYFIALAFHTGDKDNT